MRRLSLALLIDGGLLALTASSAAATASRAEYAAQVNPICAAAEVEASDAIQKAGPKPGQLIKALKKLDGISEEAIARIALVAAAPGDEVLAASWVQSLTDMNHVADRGIKTTAKLFRLLKARRPNLRALKGLTKKLKGISNDSDQALAQSSALASQLGATGCVGDHAPAIQV